MELISQNPFEEVLDAIFEVIPYKSVENYQSMASELVSITLSHRNLSDLELILSGAFAPLNGFMNKKDYDSVLENMRLANGVLWPMPVVLEVDRRLASTVKPGQEIALRDTQGLLLAILLVNDVWKPNKKHEALAVYQSLDENHPGLVKLFHEVKDFYIGGEVIPLSSPQHFNFNHLRFTPAQLKEKFQQHGWKKIVAFHTQALMHKAERELTLQAAKITGAKCLIHPVVAQPQSGVFDDFMRVRCYEHLIKTYPSKSAILALLPLTMRMAGPREALWHAIIRKNYGCTHFIIGRDHASPNGMQQEQKYYHSYEAQTLALSYQSEIDIEIVPLHEPLRRFSNILLKRQPLVLSDAELQQKLKNHEELPANFSYQSIIDELRKVYPVKAHLGFAVLITGVSCLEKSLLASGLSSKLKELTNHHVTLLDNEAIQAQLSRGLNTSEKDRELMVKRVGYVVREINKHGGIIVCELSASSSMENYVLRKIVAEGGGFIEVHVLMSSDKDFHCSANEIAQAPIFFDRSISPEITVDVSSQGINEAIDAVLKEVKLCGYIS